LLRYNYLLRER